MSLDETQRQHIHKAISIFRLYVKIKVMSQESLVKNIRDKLF